MALKAAYSALVLLFLLNCYIKDGSSMLHVTPLRQCVQRHGSYHCNAFRRGRLLDPHGTLAAAGVGDGDVVTVVRIELVAEGWKVSRQGWHNLKLHLLMADAALRVMPAGLGAALQGVQHVMHWQALRWWSCRKATFCCPLVGCTAGAMLISSFKCNCM